MYNTVQLQCTGGCRVFIMHTRGKRSGGRARAGLGDGPVHASRCSGVTRLPRAVCGDAPARALTRLGGEGGVNARGTRASDLWPVGLWMQRCARDGSHPVRVARHETPLAPVSA